jgi:hypothetical protein
MKRQPIEEFGPAPDARAVRAAERLVFAPRAPRQPHRGAHDSSVGDLVRGLVGANPEEALAGLAIELDVLAAALEGLAPRDLVELPLPRHVAALARRASIAIELHRRLAASRTSTEET